MIGYAGSGAAESVARWHWRWGRFAFSTRTGGAESSSSKRSELVIVTEKNGVKTLRMNRPKKLNAWTQPMLKTLFSEMDKAADSSSDTQALIITGTGDYYCAGADLGALLRPMMPAKLVESIREANETLFNMFIDYPLPIVIAVNGHAIGASVTSAALCDAVVASDRATFITPFYRLGIAAEGCSTVNFPRLMGNENAHRMLGPEGWRPSASDALEAGLITDVVAPEDLHASAQEAAETLISTKKGKRKLAELGLIDEYKRVNAEESIALSKSLVSKRFFDSQYKMAAEKGRSNAKLFWFLRKVQPLLAAAVP